MSGGRLSSALNVVTSSKAGTPSSTSSLGLGGSGEWTWKHIALGAVGILVVGISSYGVYSFFVKSSDSGRKTKSKASSAPSKAGTESGSESSSKVSFHRAFVSSHRLNNAVILNQVLSSWVLGLIQKNSIIGRILQDPYHEYILRKIMQGNEILAICYKWNSFQDISSKLILQSAVRFLQGLS